MGTSEGFTGRPGEVTSESGRIGSGFRNAGNRKLTPAQRAVLERLEHSYRTSGMVGGGAWSAEPGHAAPLNRLLASGLVERRPRTTRPWWRITPAGLAVLAEARP